MDLILWRHAEAQAGYPDSERALTPEGRRQADAMAAWLKSRLPAGCRVVASPAARAQETARALAAGFATSVEVGTAATPDQVLAAVGWPYGEETVVVVGHQPTLGAVAALALTGKPYPWSVSAGSIWWLSRPAHARETRLRAALTTDLL